MAHLHHLSLSSILTGMTCRNLAIVWAPNLLRSLRQDMASEESLRDIGVQAKVIECFIENFHELFSDKSRLLIESARRNTFREISIDHAVARAKSAKKCNISISQQSLYSDLSVKRNKKTSHEEFKCPPAQDSPYLSQKPPFQHFQKRGSQSRRDCSMPAVPNRHFQKVKT